MKQLKSRNATELHEAVRAIKSFGKQAVPDLARLLNPSEEKTLRIWVAFTLGEIGPEAKGAAEALRGALKDPDLTVRIHSAQALWKVTQDTKEALPVVLAGLDDRDPRVVLLSADIAAQ